MDNAIIADALNLYQKSRDYRQEVETSWRELADQYMECFATDSTSRKTKVKSKLGFQAVQRFVSKTKKPERRFLTSDIDPLALEIAKDGVNTVQERGGLNDALNTNWGIMSKNSWYGTSFLHVMPNTEEDGMLNDYRPVLYRQANLQDVFIDPFATHMRSEGMVQAATEVFVRYTVSYDQAERMFPNKEFSRGALPMSYDDYNRIDMSASQSKEQQGDKVEIGYYYNIAKKKPIQAILIGATAKIVSKLEGDSYPYFLKKMKGGFVDPFIPLIAFKCFPVPKGFYGRGLGHLLHDLTVIQQKLRELAMKQVEDQVNPVNIMNIQGDPKDFWGQYNEVRHQRAKGEKGFIMNVVQEGGVPSSAGSITSLQTQALTQEYERFMTDIVNEVKRCGIPIDDIDRPVSETATATIAEETRATAFVQQVQEQNSDAYKDIDLFTMAILRDMGDENSETPIYTQAKLQAPQEAQVLPQEAVTYGALVDLLNTYDFAVDVQGRTGALKTDLAQKAELSELMSYAQGTPLLAKLIGKRLRMAHLGYNDEDIQAIEQSVSEGQPKPQQQGAGNKESVRALQEALQPV